MLSTVTTEPYAFAFRTNVVKHHTLTATQTVTALFTVQPRPTRTSSTQAESALPQDPTKRVSQRINILANAMQKDRVPSRPSPTTYVPLPFASLPTGSRLGDRHDSPPADTKNRPFPARHMCPALSPALVPCTDAQKPNPCTHRPSS